MIPLKKWFTVGREIHKGDLVVVSEDNLARGQWQRERVEATHPGRDGHIRYLAIDIWKSYPSSRAAATPF